MSLYCLKIHTNVLMHVYKSYLINALIELRPYPGLI